MCCLDMDKVVKCVSMSWKLVLLLELLHLVYTCPSPCTCRTYPSNKLLSNLLLSNTSAIVEEIESVMCVRKELEHVPSDIPSNILFLDLRENNLVTIGNELYNLTDLETLIINDNRLRTLEYGMFGNLSRLHTLQLKKNNISVIEPFIFRSLPELRHVDLAKNQLLSWSSDTLSDLCKLKFLNVSYNQITVIQNETFQDLAQLEVLDLSFNQIESLPFSIFDDLKNLKILNLSHNHIKMITMETFQYMKRLEVLDLSYNNIGLTSRFTFNSLQALRSLDLSNNTIIALSNTNFLNLTNLRSLTLNSNLLSEIDIPVFKDLRNLTHLSISQMPYLAHLGFDAFQGLNQLTNLSLSFNPRLTFINPHLFSPLRKLQNIDLHGNNISYLSALTFHSNLNLTTVNLTHNPFVCHCDIAWLNKYVQNLTCAIENGDTVPLIYVNEETFPCANITAQKQENNSLHFKVGKSARLTCDVTLDTSMIVIWTTPRKKIYTYHAFHPDATKHHPNVDFAYEEPEWVNSTTYHSEMIYREDRVLVLSDGSLFIDYMLRSDTGPYKCEVRNAYHNVTQTINVWLDYKIVLDVVLWSIIIGFSCALSFFVLIVVYTLIRACTIRVINKRRRDAIRQLLENLDAYKRTQITKIRDHYSTQLGRVSEHYHNQLERLRNNYSMQMGRVKRGCSHQVDRIRDNYNTQVGRLKDYSSHQIDQLRSAYNNQVLKIRDFGSLQFDRLRETCKQGQMNVMKLMETMNIENCKGIVETECMRTESMVFEPEFGNDDVIQGMSLIDSESEYITASDSDGSKSSPSRDVDIGEPCDQLEDIFNPTLFTETDRNNTDSPPVTLEMDLGDISMETVI